MKTVLNPLCMDFQELLSDLPSAFEGSQRSIHKARNELKIIQYEGERLVLKSFKVPGLLQRLIYTFLRPSKAERSYQNSLLLERFTPTPIGFVEYSRNGLLSHSYFLSECFEYDFTIREPLLDADFEDRDNVLKAFARFTLDLHNAGIFHKDYSPGNILIKRASEGGYQFKIVDVNRMRIQAMDAEMRAKGFEKLWASDADLQLIAEEYQSCAQVPDNFCERVCHYSNKNKKIKNFKKRLKGKPVND